MKKSIQIAIVASILALATNAFATNFSRAYYSWTEIGEDWEVSNYVDSVDQTTECYTGIDDITSYCERYVVRANLNPSVNSNLRLNGKYGRVAKSGTSQYYYRNWDVIDMTNGTRSWTNNWDDDWYGDYVSGDTRRYYVGVTHENWPTPAGLYKSDIRITYRYSENGDLYGREFVFHAIVLE